MKKPLMRTPDFYIVGAPKCGTTAFDFYLDSHPKINMIEKEIHYWGKDLKYVIDRKNLKEKYNKQIEINSKPDSLLGEGAVWYLASSEAARELKANSPDAKILIFLRNPIEACHSLYSNMFFNGNETLESFESAIKSQHNRDLSQSNHFNCPTIAFQYQEIYSYFEQVQRYIEAFGKENVKVVVFEEFVENKQMTYDDVLSFLGFDSHQINFKKINANKEIRFEIIRSLVFTPKNRLKSIVKLIIPIKSWRENVKLKLLTANTKETIRSEMKLETKRVLQEYFKSDIKKLEQLIGKDLSNWNK